MLKKQGTYGVAVAVLLAIVALALRFWDLGSIPLLHDEISALDRTDFDGLFALIRGGVAIDTHPAFTQVLLWLWSPIADGDTWWLRVPFALMGWASVVVMWRFVDVAADRFRANLVAAVLAAGQLFIYNSEMTRPYAPGMLFTALYTLSWYRWVVLERRSAGRFVWMSIWMALAAYTHYFALLTVVVIWISGWFYVRRLPIVRYILHAGLALLLFAPHLSVFITQLGYGGIGGPDGWLRPPRSGDVMDWIWEVFNFNVLLTSIAVISWVFGLVRFAVVDREKGKIWGILWFWFGAILIVGFAYSHLVNPVLYILPLVFALPYAVVAASWPWKTDDVRIRVAVPLAVAGVMIYSLFVTRDHYDVMSRQPFAFAVQNLADRPDAFVAVNLNPDYIAYVQKKQGRKKAEPQVSTYREPMPLQRRAELLTEYAGRTYCSDGHGADLDFLASRRFPHVAEMVEGYTFTGWVFTEGPDNRSDYFSTWAANDDTYEGADEFYPIATLPMDTLELSFANEIRTAVDFAATPPDNLHLVYVMTRGEENVHWSAVKPVDGAFFQDRFTLVKNLLLWDIFQRREDMAGARLSIYLWNPDLQGFSVAGFEVLKVKANPYRYGLLSRRP